MSTYCLVHGSTQNPSGWDLLVSELHALGHECVCADLPTDEPEAGARRYAEVIGRALNGRGPAIVVAHSASGVFLPLVPDYAPVTRLVYLGAAIPQLGESLVSQFRAAPEMFHPDWPGKDPTKDKSLALHYLFHDCAPQVAQWALSTLRLMNASAAMKEICPLTQWPKVFSTTSLALKIARLAPYGGKKLRVSGYKLNPFGFRLATRLTSLNPASWRQSWIR